MSTAEISEGSAEKSIRVRKILRAVGWSSAFLLALVFFTVSKLPDDRIGSIVLSEASQALSSPGHLVQLSAERTRISLLLLGRLRFEGLQIIVRKTDGSPMNIRWDEARLSPSIANVLLGRLGGSVKIIHRGKTMLSASFWGKRSGNFSFSGKLEEADLGDAGIGVLPFFAGLSATLPLSGSIKFSGEGKPETTSGSVELTLGNTKIQAQRIEGFDVPSIHIGDGEIRLTVDKGKVKISTLRLGRLDRDSDDISGNATGELTLAPSLENSQLNLSARLKISEAILTKYFILTGFLGAKQADGAFNFKLVGPLSFIQPIPAGGSP